MVKINRNDPTTWFWFVLVCVSAGIAGYSPLGQLGSLSSLTPILRGIIVSIITAVMFFMFVGGEGLIDWYD